MKLRRRDTLKLCITLALLAAFSLVGAPPAMAQAVHQTTTVHYFADGTPVMGASAALTRNSNGASVRLRTHHLEGGATYTLWWVVFNDPDKCSAPGCGEDDIFNANGTPNMEQINNVGISVVFGAGHVVGNNSKASFASHISEGELSGVLLGVGELANAEQAEFHLVIRNHGQPIAGMVADQISSFGGGCDTTSGGVLEPGEGNVCVDEQFAVFMAP